MHNVMCNGVCAVCVGVCARPGLQQPAIICCTPVCGAHHHASCVCVWSVVCTGVLVRVRVLVLVLVLVLGFANIQI
jgi:hypothetical protein